MVLPIPSSISVNNIGPMQLHLFEGSFRANRDQASKKRTRKAVKEIYSHNE